MSKDTFTLDISSLIIVEGLPKVTSDKYEKLYGALKKEFGKYGVLVESSIDMPYSENETIGIAFIEYVNASDAEKAVINMNNTSFLSKKIIISVYKYSDFEQIVNHSEKFVEPTIAEIEFKYDLSDWLNDSSGRDQYLVRYNKETEIYFNDPLRGGRVLYYGGEREKSLDKVVTEMTAEWSPSGNYMATLHPNGVVCWGGASMNKIWRLAHNEVKEILFSPCDRYLLTYSEKGPNCMHIWDLRTGTSRLTMPHNEWPLFKWSFNGQYLARIIPNGIEIIDSETMKPMEGSPLKVPGVVDFLWSPAANTLSYWTPEMGNSPARVVIMSIPNKILIRDKHLVFVTTLTMQWHSTGSHLLVHATRSNPKTKAPMPFMLEIFSLNEKNVPVEDIEIKESIEAIAWDNSSVRFALITKTENIEDRSTVSIYFLNGKKFVVENTLTQRTCTKLVWSPTNSNLIMATIPAGEKNIELYEATKKDSIIFEHPLATDFYWCPSGRYLISAVTQPFGSTSLKHQVDNGYRVWNAKGKLVYSSALTKCYAVLWRPRPATLLTKPQIKEIKKNLSEHSKVWEDSDSNLRDKFSTGAVRERLLMREKWLSYRSVKVAEALANELRKTELYGGKLIETTEVLLA